MGEHDRFREHVEAARGLGEFSDGTVRALTVDAVALLADRDALAARVAEAERRATAGDAAEVVAQAHAYAAERDARKAEALCAALTADLTGARVEAQRGAAGRERAEAMREALTDAVAVMETYDGIDAKLVAVCNAALSATPPAPRSAEEDRADICAWLRATAERIDSGDLAHGADAIEAGEHVGASGKGGE